MDTRGLLEHKFNEIDLTTLVGKQVGNGYSIISCDFIDGDFISATIKHTQKKQMYFASDFELTCDNIRLFNELGIKHIRIIVENNIETNHNLYNGRLRIACQKDDGIDCNGLVIDTQILYIHHTLQTNTFKNLNINTKITHGLTNDVIDGLLKDNINLKSDCITITPTQIHTKFDERIFLMEPQVVYIERNPRNTKHLKKNGEVSDEMLESYHKYFLDIDIESLKKLYKNCDFDALTIHFHKYGANTHYFISKDKSCMETYFECDRLGYFFGWVDTRKYPEFIQKFKFNIQ